MALVEHDHVIEALAAQRADDTLGNGIRLGRTKWGEDRLNPHPASTRDEIPAELGIAIADQIAGVLPPWGRFADLLPTPGRRRELRDILIGQGAAIMREHEEDVEGAERERLDG